MPDVVEASGHYIDLAKVVMLSVRRPAPAYPDWIPEGGGPGPHVDVHIVGDTNAPLVGGPAAAALMAAFAARPGVVRLRPSDRMECEYALVAVGHVLRAFRWSDGGNIVVFVLPCIVGRGNLTFDVHRDDGPIFLAAYAPGG